MKNRYTPPYPSFAIYKWGLRGYTCHRHVSLMMKFRYQVTKSSLLVHHIYKDQRVSFIIMTFRSMFYIDIWG